jgi:hypothetical protein
LISQSENFPIPKILFRCRRKDWWGCDYWLR